MVVRETKAGDMYVRSSREVRSSRVGLAESRVDASSTMIIIVLGWSSEQYRRRMAARKAEKKRYYL